MPENDSGISVVTNSKILPYTVQGLNLSCIEQNTLVIEWSVALILVLIRASILTCCVNIAALRITMFYSIVQSQPKALQL